MWYFWLYLVPKSFVVFYIIYFSYNLTGVPADLKTLLLDLCIGGALLFMVFLQKIFRPRFIFKSEHKGQQLWVEGMKVTDLDNIMETQELVSKKTNISSDATLNLNQTPSSKHNNSLQLQAFLSCKDKIECGICWDVIHVTSLSSVWQRVKSGLFGSKKGVITNCGHTYHSSCLKKWVAKKQECPMCRKKITCK